MNSRVHIFSPEADRQVRPTEVPKISEIFRTMVDGWVQGAEIWRDLAEEASAQGNADLAAWAGNLALERDEWAKRDAAAAVEWERREQRQLEAGHH